MKIHPEEVYDILFKRNEVQGWGDPRITTDDLDTADLKSMAEDADYLGTQLAGSARHMSALLEQCVNGLPDDELPHMIGGNINMLLGMASAFDSLSENLKREAREEAKQ